MPRRLKGKTGGIVFHVMNRAVRKATLFSTTADYEAFFKALREAYAKYPVRILAISVMPTHFHLVIWPQRDGDLTRFVGRFTHLHACRWQRAHHTRGTGPVYQGRFKSVPVESGVHVYRLIRYVERNAVRGGLVGRVEEWPWCSASTVLGSDMPPLSAWPVPKPPNWLEFTNQEQPPEELTDLREAVWRERPYGSEVWRQDISARLGWRRGLRPAGRPLNR